MAEARSVVDVILGEAAPGSPQQRYDDMVAVASAMVNRSRQLGVPLEDVVGLQSQFNAYGRSLPPGVDRYRTMAERALNDVLQNGPVHNGTFYATPSATGNLPRGLSEVTRTNGHIYYSDPQNRSINTASGYRTPSMNSFMPTDVPTPTARPATSFSNVFTPATPQPVERRDLKAPEPQQMAFDSARFGPVPSLEQFDSGRFGTGSYVTPSQLAQALAEQRAGLIGPVAPSSMPTRPGQQTSGLLSPPPAEIGPVQTPLDFAAEVDAYRQSIGKPPVNADLLNPAPAYIDPVVTTSPSTVQQTRPSLTRAPVMDQPTAGTRQGTQRQGLFGGMFGNGRGRTMAGGLAGGIGGGLIGGPIGALLGGLLGREVANRTYFPQAPTPFQNAGDGGLNDYGRSVMGSSDQFSNAVSSGKGGLW